MRVFYCDHYRVDLPEKHRFPMQKYALLRRSLVEQGVLRESELAPAPRIAMEELHRVHAPDYVRRFVQGELERAEVGRIGFPWSEALVQRCLASTGGTFAAAAQALEDGVSGALAGGTHHAHRDFGSGYCVFNDIAVAARSLLESGRAARVLVVDLDVHQGDGTAAIFAGDERVFTLSLHGAKNFPARKAQSDLDVPLADGIGDEEYLETLDAALDQAWERSQPDFVFYQGGVDPLDADRLGRLRLSHAGLLERDRRVLAASRDARVPVVLTLGGGYGDPIEASIEAHVGTWRTVRELFASAAP